MTKLNASKRTRSWLLLIACISSAGQAAEVRPGLWEFRSTSLSVAGVPASRLAQLQEQVRQLPPEMQGAIAQQLAARGVSLGGDAAVRSCLSPEQAREKQLYRAANCSLVGITDSGKVVRGQVICTSPQARGSFEAFIDTPEHFTGRVDIRAAERDANVQVDARWLAAQCGTVGALP